jgi:hypothetical protein
VPVTKIPARSLPDDRDLDALLSASGIAIPDTEREAILGLARFFLEQAELLADPLPFDLEPPPSAALPTPTGRA